MFKKTITFLLLAAAFIPAAAFAQDVADAKAKCLTPAKGYIKTAIEKKLTDDLRTQGLINPKVRIKIAELAPATPLPAELKLKDVFANTALTVTPVTCPQEPCITPPTIAFTTAASAVIGSCEVKYSLDAKYTFFVETHQQVDGQTQTKRVKITGSLTSQVAIPGSHAPYAKKK